MALARRHELNPLKEPEYEIEDVPRAKGSGEGSAATRLSERTQWIGNLAEMILVTNRAGEDFERKAVANGDLVLHPGKPLSLEYIADRVDTDDPLWGWTLRTEKEGWLQGYVTVTTFTTWQRWFRWDSLCEAAGLLPVDRVPLGPNATLEEQKTQEWWDQRVIDGDGRLARALNRQIRDGDWSDEGVIWPRIAEVSLLGGLGCGGLLLDGVIEELLNAKDRQYDYLICQATENAVPFYESRGFVRVGAIARYEQKIPESEVRSVDSDESEMRKKKKPVVLDEVESMHLEPGVMLPGTSSPCEWITSLQGDTPAKIAKRLSGVRSSDITFLNRRLYRGLHENSLLIPGTKLRVPKVHPYDLKRDNEPVAPFRVTSGKAKDILENDSRAGSQSTNGYWYSSLNGETIRRIASRFGIEAEALTGFNKARYGELKDSSALQEGTVLWLPQQPLNLHRLYALQANHDDASNQIPVTRNGLDEQKLNGRGRTNSKKIKLDFKLNQSGKWDSEVKDWFTEDEAERNTRKEEMELHKSEIEDPKLTEFYATEKCDDISVIEGRQTKRLSEVMAYRHWTFPDEPAALTVPSYMMVLPLNKEYLCEHVPSIRKNNSALRILQNLAEVAYPVPPYMYGFDENAVVNESLKIEKNEEVPTQAETVEAAKDSNQNSAGPTTAVSDQVKAYPVKISLRCEAIRSWRQGPVASDPTGSKIFLKGSPYTPALVAVLPNGPLKPRPPQPPKRPTSSFLEFCAAERPSFIAKYPNKIPREITVLLTDAWKKAGPEVKIRFEKMSEHNREVYHAQAEKYRRDLIEFHQMYGLDENTYDVDHPGGPKLRKTRNVETKRGRGHDVEDLDEDDDGNAHPRIQRIVSDRLLAPHHPRLFNKVVTLKPKRTATKRTEWLEENLSDAPPPPPSAPPPPSSSPPCSSSTLEPHFREESPQYYFTLTYIPDLQWCRLAPLQEAGTFLAGMSKKKGYERHVGRTRWVLAPETVGREIDVSATRCVPVSRAFPVKNVSDADKEEWDIIDEPK